MSLTFDVPVMNVDATLTAVTLIDPAGMPSRVIDTDTGFQVRVDWQLTGPGVLFLGGSWTVRALVESIGAGFEGQIGPTMVQPLNGGNNYSTIINVAAHSVPPPPNTDTVYKLVVLVSHTAVNGVKTEMAGFGDGPVFEIRNP